MSVVSDYTAILYGVSWWGSGVTGRPVFLTYSFSTALPPYSLNITQELLQTFTPLTDDDKAVARNALSQWADASGITFFEVPAGQGDLQFRKFDFDVVGNGTINGMARFPTGLAENGQAGDIFIDLFDFAPLYEKKLYLHEIGHALGLKHSFDDHDLGLHVLRSDLDNWTQTVMTYTNAGPFSGTLGPLDIQAIQHLYGGPGSDGTQVASWAWDAANYVLTQTGGAGNDTIRGVHAADRIHGGAGNDIIYADAGDDIITGGPGNDTLNGGSGLDFASYADATSRVVVNLAFAFDQNTLGSGTHRFSGIEGLIGSAFDDALTGNSTDNVLEGGAGNDTLDGGAGNDTVSYASDTAGVWVSLDGASGIASGSDTLSNFENITGGAGNDTLEGNGGNNVLTGAAGSDTLIGGDGVDTGAFAGSLFDYTIAQSGSSTIVSGIDGTDTLTGIERLTFADLVIDDAARIIVWKCVMPVRYPEFVSLADQQAFEPQAPQFAPDWSGASCGTSPLVPGADPQVSFGMVEHSALGSTSLFGAS